LNRNCDRRYAAERAISSSSKDDEDFLCAHAVEDSVSEAKAANLTPFQLPGEWNQQLVVGDRLAVNEVWKRSDSLLIDEWYRFDFLFFIAWLVALRPGKK